MEQPLVILAAHGCGDDSLTNRLVRELAQGVGARLGCAVREAFNLGRPGYAEVAGALPEAGGVVVPLMLSEGYFLRVLGDRLRDGAGGRRVEVLPVIGVWGSVAGAVVGRACDAVGEGSEAARRTRVVVVGHGTERNPESGATTVALAERIENESGAASEAVFLDQQPELAEYGFDCAHRFVVVPWLLGGGDHAQVDVPEAMGFEPTIDAEAGEVRRREEDGVEFVLLPAVLHNTALLDAVCDQLGERLIGGVA